MFWLKFVADFTRFKFWIVHSTPVLWSSWRSRHFAQDSTLKLYYSRLPCGEIACELIICLLYLSHGQLETIASHVGAFKDLNSIVNSKMLIVEKRKAHLYEQDCLHLWTNLEGMLYMVGCAQCTVLKIGFQLLKNWLAIKILIWLDGSSS